MATDSVQWTCLDAPTLGPRMSHDPRSVGLARHLSTEHAATRTYTGSPLARRNIATASPAPQRGYHGATTRLLRELLRGYYEATTGLLRGYYVATTRLLQGYYQATTRLPLGYYKATTRSRPRATRPAAQQRQHRSSAGLSDLLRCARWPLISKPTVLHIRLRLRV